MNYFNRYGRKNGFKAYILRYLLKLNHHHNLLLSEAEFSAVLATVFAAKVDIPWYHCLCIVPSRRCVTIASSFLVSSNHSMTLLQSLLVCYCPTAGLKM